MPELSVPELSSLASQALTGLASASSLFLVASGLTLIYGVCRVVNFAHGSLAMLGAFIGYTLATATPLGFWGALAVTPLLLALLGAAVEASVLRRLNGAPELVQLLATFALVLVVQDAALAIWGPQDLLGPRAPGLRGAVEIWGVRFPLYDLFLIALGPAVLLVLWAALRFTRLGLLLRAATQDREMLGALGVDQRRLFTATFALGSGLAGLAGALILPREAVSLHLDLALVVDAFVVVVVGGLGSLPGAFLAAVLIGLLQAFGILAFPRITLVLTFLVMAAVLALRPRGLLGRDLPPPPEDVAPPLPRREVLSGRVLLGAVAAAAMAAPFLPDPVLVLLTEIAVMALFATSLHLLVGPAGIPSFGHAAFFGGGAYAAALLVKHLGAPMWAGLLAGPVAAAALGLLASLVVLRRSGVYAAMLTLAFAQLLYAAAFQWDTVTGGDNGILGVWPASWARHPLPFFLMALALCGLATGLLRRAVRLPFGLRLRAARDNADRAAASGLDVTGLRRAAFTLAAAGAGLAGAVFAYSKGSVFPTLLGIPRSVDALLMVMLGGLHSIAGPILGAAAWTVLNEQLLRATPYWRGALGLLILALVLFFPQGLLGRRRA